MKKGLFVIAFAGAFTASAFAEEQVQPLEQQEERVTFGKWRIGVGGAFNAKVRSQMGMRNLTVPGGYVVPYGSTKADAMARAKARKYDGGGFIDKDSEDNGFDTENWSLPVSSYQGSGRFALDNAYEEVVSSTVGYDYRDDSDDRNQFGISLEASRELWIHDENDEHRWGLDFTAAFSYFFGRSIYNARTDVTRSEEVRNGVIRTLATDADAMYDYDQGLDRPVGGMYGYGNYNRTMFNPAFGFSGIGSPDDMGGPARSLAASYGYAANGDYQELEMLFMLRPWYEITDWWRVFAEVGVGVSWGRFDTTFYGPFYSFDENFAQWDCYGVAGLGTSFRYKDYTLSIDFLGRFLRDDFDVDGRYVRGGIRRSDWGFRLMVGYEF